MSGFQPSPGRSSNAPHFAPTGMSSQHSPTVAPQEDTDNIFDRIRKMEFDQRGDEFYFEQETGQRNLLPLSSSRFQFFNSSSGSRLAMNHAPPTSQEIVQSLNDDPFLTRPLVTGDGYSIDDVYRYFTSLSGDTFVAAFTEMSDQIRRLAIVDSLASTVGHLHDVDSGIAGLEQALTPVFPGRQVIIWYNVPTAKTLYSPTRKLLVSPGVGIVGHSADTLKRRIVSNPKESEWYSIETDEELFGSSVAVICSPIADPLTHELVAVVSITAKSAWSQFDNVLLQHLESKLPPLLSTLKTTATRIRSTLSILSSATGSELKQRALVSTSCQTIKTTVNSENAQIYFVNFEKNTISYYPSMSGKKVNIPLKNGGIAAFVAQTRTTVNIPVASDHPHFSRTLDDDFRSRALLAAPMIDEADTVGVLGVVVARAKKGGLVFDEHDVSLFQSLTVVTTRTLTNFRRYRSDVLNLKRVLTAQDHYIELLTTAESLASLIDKNSLFEVIMTRSRRLVNADRCSLFTTDKRREYLLSKVASGTSRPIVIPIHQGIAGKVATTGEMLNIKDAYEDPRFSKDVDLATGYRTRSILCLPIFGRNREVIGVTQMINKENGVFTDGDADLMKAFNIFCGIALGNANLFEETNTMKARVEGLLDLAVDMTKARSLPLLMERVASSAKDLVRAERCSVVLGKTRGRESGSLSVDIVDGKGEVIGFIEIVNKVPGFDGVSFTEDDVRVANALASFSGFAIERLSKKPEGIEVTSGFGKGKGLGKAEEEGIQKIDYPAREVDPSLIIEHCFSSWVEALGIDFTKLSRLLAILSASYIGVPYRNLSHAAEVVQMIHAILHITGEVKRLEPLEIFSLLTAALLHNPPGHTPMGKDPLGYMEKERERVETAIDIIAVDDGLVEGIDSGMKDRFWNLFVQLISSSGVEGQGDFIRLWRSGDHGSLNRMRLILKLANFGGVCRPYEISMSNARLLAEEDGWGDDIATRQADFAENFVIPLLDIASSTWNGIDTLRKQVGDNMKMWRESSGK